MAIDIQTIIWAAIGGAVLAVFTIPGLVVPFMIVGALVGFFVCLKGWV